MTPRYKPPTIREKGLENHLKEQGINYKLFVLLSRARLNDTAIAKAVSEDYKERTGIEHRFSPRSIKTYRQLVI